MRTPLALGLVLAVLAAPVGVLTWRGDRRLPRVWPTAAALGLVAALAVVAGRGTLTSLVTEDTPAPSDRGRDAVLMAEAMHYATAVAPDVLRRYQAIQAAAIDADAESREELRLLQEWGSGVVQLQTVAGFG